MSDSEETIWDPISSLGRVMPPSDFVLDSSRSFFSQTKKNWPERLLPRPSPPQTLTHMWIHFPANFPFKFNLPSAIELSETADCVYNFVETLCKRSTSVAYLTYFSLNFYEIFKEDASLLLLYHGAKK